MVRNRLLFGLGPLIGATISWLVAWTVVDIHTSEAFSIYFACNFFILAMLIFVSTFSLPVAEANPFRVRSFFTAICLVLGAICIIVQPFLRAQLKRVFNLPWSTFLQTLADGILGCAFSGCTIMSSFIFTIVMRRALTQDRELPAFREVQTVFLLTALNGFTTGCLVGSATAAGGDKPEYDMTSSIMQVSLVLGAGFGMIASSVLYRIRDRYERMTDIDEFFELSGRAPFDTGPG